MLLGAAWVVAHRQLAVTLARDVARTFIIAAEKRAESLVLTDGPTKLSWVVDHGYDLLPGVVRLVVSKPLFTSIVQHEFNVAVAWAEKHVVAPVPAV